MYHPVLLLSITATRNVSICRWSPVRFRPKEDGPYRGFVPVWDMNRGRRAGPSHAYAAFYNNQGVWDLSRQTGVKFLEPGCNGERFMLSPDLNNIVNKEERSFAIRASLS